MIAQEVVGLEVLEAEAGAASGVDLDDALDAERVRIIAFGFCNDRGRSGSRRRRGGSGGRCGGRADGRDTRIVRLRNNGGLQGGGSGARLGPNG